MCEYPDKIRTLLSVTDRRTILPRTTGHRRAKPLRRGRRGDPRPAASGRIAQLARARLSHSRGHRFESCCAHYPVRGCRLPARPNPVTRIPNLNAGVRSSGRCTREARAPSARCTCSVGAVCLSILLRAGGIGSARPRLHASNHRGSGAGCGRTRSRSTRARSARSSSSRTAASNCGSRPAASASGVIGTLMSGSAPLFS